MDAQELLHILPPEEAVTDTQANMLEQFTVSMPWFAAGQVLALKAMVQRGQPAVETRLAQVALYVSSRSALKQYLDRVSVVPRPLVVAPDIPVTPQPSVLDDDGFELLAEDIECDVYVDTPGEAMQELGHLAQGMVPNAQYKKTEDKNARLIDRFMQNAGTASAMLKQKAVNASDDDLAAPSVQTLPGIISETLVEIYLKQGFADKARHTYNELCLLYPEKKAYFASRFALFQS